MVECQSEDRHPHRHAKATAPYGADQPGAGVDGPQCREVLSLQRLDPDNRAFVFDGQVEAP